jgi:intron-binding protein aquarius
VEFINNSGNPQPTRPFKITFPPPPRKAASKKGKKRKAGEEPGEEEQPVASRPKLIAESYAPQNPGPYPQDKPPENSVRFTPVQVCLSFWHTMKCWVPVGPQGLGDLIT